MFRKQFCRSLFFISVLALAACGGGSGGGGGTTSTYTIGVTVSGLTGSGLVLQNNGGDDLSISADGSSSFATQVADGEGYSVTVLTQPTTPAQICSVSNGSGTVAAANITNVSVTCVTTYTINVSVSGLTGSGLVLQNNGGDDLTIGADGSFSFTTQLLSADSYYVTVLTQPTAPAQVCTVSNGSGTVATADITNVNVNCVNTYTIGVTVSGLVGSGLVLQNNGGDDLSISVDGSFSFTAPLVDNSSYSVVALSQPTSPWQNCVVTNGSGTVTGADITNVSVTCTTNTYTISGTVSGLTGSGMVLQNNSGDDLGISTDGSFIFYTAVASGTTYSISILTQPSLPAQQCEVVKGNGVVTNSNLTDVEVLCSNYWTWISGSDVVNQNGVYGTQGVADAANVPGGRRVTVSWIDSSDNLWLFGGNGYDSAGTLGRLNDLWKFDGSDWTWVSGSDTANQLGVYGTKGVANSANAPGGRYGATSWNGSSNTFWLFGGYGHSHYTNVDYQNDLWKFDGTNWTWVSGTNGSGLQGVYGAKGVADANNMPGGRAWATSWTDSSGNLWLFGGYGYATTNARVRLNDLWRFDGTNWTWISGSNLAEQPGVYGTQGVANAANAPGARTDAVSWVDSSNNLWLFGGSGFDSAGTFGRLNDLWKFDGTNWTWVSGSNVVNQTAVYGTQGVASASNIPGARTSAISWSDSSGNMWLYGGHGYGSSGIADWLCDRWKFDGTNWTWVSGSNIGLCAVGYGVQGIPGAANLPGGRASTNSWIDSSETLWLFGGYGVDNIGSVGYLNDLWHYMP